MAEWVNIISLGANISIIIVGLRLIRHLSRMEFKVDLMWTAFRQKFNIELDKSDE